MNTKRSILTVSWRLAAFAAAMIVLLVVVVTAIMRPVSGAVNTYTALFTDASGLKTGDDIRMFGLQVGKVQAIDIDHNQARIRFTVQRDRPLYDASVLAIRYQSLTGQRYIDVKQPDKPGTTVRSGTSIGTDHTIPSFDITALFNGLEPVLAEFSPGALNQFTSNVLAVIQGDGSGIGPALDSLQKLSDFVTDRQALFSTLMSNLRAISDQVHGSSPHLVTLLRGIADVFQALQEKVDGLLVFADNAPQALGPINDLIATLGFTEPTNPNLETDLRLLFPNPQVVLDVLGKVPGVLQSLNALIPDTRATANHIVLTCSKGKADMPTIMQVLIGGQRISVCNG